MKENYVWYACYGSNLLEERFYTYIKGGKIESSSKFEVGARDKTLPLKEEKININYKLFFSDSSSRWNNQGIAFLNPVYDKKENTLGKMYLIKKEQFLDIVKQENNIEISENIRDDFFDLKENDTDILFSNSKYGRIICLGEYSGFKIFTFTCVNKMDNMDIKRPSEEYFNVISEGISKTYKISIQESSEYLNNILSDGIYDK